MLRKFVLTTAIVALTAGGALAQTAPTQPAPVKEAAPVQQPPTVKPITEGNGHLASSLLGESVYNSAAEDAVSLGNVNDILIGPDGNVSQLIVGVGGFLGIGAKDVAIDYKTAEVAERSGDVWLIVKATKEQLEAAPAFDRTTFTPPTQTTAVEAGAVTPAPAQDSASAQPETDLQETAAINKATLTPLPEVDLSAGKLNGTTVFGSGDDRIGEVGDVIVAEGKVEAVVLDVGGFLGVGEKPVAVSLDNLGLMTDEDGKVYLYTPFTKEQLEAQTPYDAASFETNRQKQILRTTP